MRGGTAAAVPPNGTDTMNERLQRIRQNRAPREVTLSDGSTILIRPVKLQNLVMNKRIPLTLVRKMERMDRTPTGGIRLEDAVEVTEAIDAVVMAAAVDPRITVEPTEETLGLDEIDFEDRVLIFTEANRTAAALAPFPVSGQPGSGDDAAPGSEGV